MRLFVIAIALLNLLGCVTMDRHRNSGYWKEESGFYTQREPLEENLIDGEPVSLPHLIQDRFGYETRMIRIGLEKRLSDLEEKRQYSQFKTLMSEAERIEFLKLQDIFERDKWLEENGFDAPEKRHSREIASLIEKNDIALGMNRLAVKDSWGDPDFIEIAGSPNSGNERWKFTDSIGTIDGFKVIEKYVYFEKGKVIGWETKK